MTWIKNTRKRLPILMAALIIVGASAAVALDAIHPASAEVTFPQLQPQFSFVVERNGALLGRFSECSGIGSENGVVEFRDGSDPNITHKVPGPVTYGDVTLKRGITADMAAWNWREEVIAGTDGFRSAMIIRMVNRDGVPLAVWRFENAWPSKISAPQPRSEGNDISLEELTIVHEYTVRIQ